MTRLGDVQRSETRRETRASLLTALLWFASAVIVFAMLLRMLPNSLDGKRYVPLIVALMPWLGLLSVIIAIIATVFRNISHNISSRERYPRSSPHMFPACIEGDAFTKVPLYGHFPAFGIVLIRSSDNL